MKLSGKIKQRDIDYYVKKYNNALPNTGRSQIVSEIVQGVSQDTGISAAYIRDAYNSTFKNIKEALSTEDFPSIFLTNMFTMHPKYESFYLMMREVRERQLQGYIPEHRVDEYKRIYMPLLHRFAKTNRKKRYETICKRIKDHQSFERIFDYEIRGLVRAGYISRDLYWVKNLEN